LASAWPRANAGKIGSPDGLVEDTGGFRGVTTWMPGSRALACSGDSKATAARKRTVSVNLLAMIASCCSARLRRRESVYIQNCKQITPSLAQENGTVFQYSIRVTLNTSLSVTVDLGGGGPKRCNKTSNRGRLPKPFAYRASGAEELMKVPFHGVSLVYLAQ
jgi:hypothetical protein